MRANKDAPAKPLSAQLHLQALSKVSKDSPLTVTQSNELIEAQYSLTLNEKRLLLMAGAKMDPQKSRKENSLIRVTAAEFAATYRITAGYEALELAAARLYERSIKSVERTRRGLPVQERRWLTGRAIYEEASVQLEFNEDVLDYMTQFTERMTTSTYGVDEIIELSSFYTVRLYELGVKALPVGEFYADLEILRETLDLGDKYSSVKDFRRYVLDSGVKQISNAPTSALTMTVEPVRTGRKVIGFKFFVEPKRQQLVSGPRKKRA